MFILVSVPIIVLVRVVIVLVATIKGFKRLEIIGDNEFRPEWAKLGVIFGSLLEIIEVIIHIMCVFVSHCPGTPAKTLSFNIGLSRTSQTLILLIITTLLSCFI